MRVKVVEAEHHFKKVKICTTSIAEFHLAYSSIRGKCAIMEDKFKGYENFFMSNKYGNEYT